MADLVDSSRRTVDIPVDIEFASGSGAAVPKMNSVVCEQVNSKLRAQVAAAEADGWTPTHPVDAQSLLDAGDLMYEVKRGLLDSKVVLLAARIELARTDSYGTMHAVETTLLSCPGGDHQASRFDVYCQTCGFYLPDRQPDNELSVRLARHWQAFENQRQQAALAAAKGDGPGVGATVARAVGFGLLGLVSGVGDVVRRDLEDSRAQRNIAEGIRSAQRQAW